MKLLLIMLPAILYTGCITGQNIEERCLQANLQIERLTIEDTLKNNALARVTCTKRN